MGNRRTFAYPLAVSAWYFLLGIGILAVSLARPVYNWDVIGYVGSVKALETSDVESVHSFAYDRVRAAVPDSTYAIIAPADVRLTDPSTERPTNVPNYRSAMRSDPVAFAEQLPLYQVRFLYIYLMLALYKIGMPIVLTTHAISGASICIGIWLLAWIVKGRVGSSTALALSVLSLAYGAITVGRLSTPDGLAFLGFMACMLLFLNGRWESMIVALALVGIRTDLILFSAPFLLSCIFFGRFRKVLSVTAFLLTCGVYFWVKWHYGYPGWSTMFRFAIGEWIPHPLTTPADVTLRQYLSAVAIGVWSGANKPAFLVFLVSGGWALLLLYRRVQSRESLFSILRFETVGALLLSIFYVLVHFLLFPELQERFFLGQYVMTTVALAVLLTARPLSFTNSGDAV